jgi:hypothetical protein
MHTNITRLDMDFLKPDFINEVLSSPRTLSEIPLLGGH